MCFKRKKKIQIENILIKYLGRNEDLVWSPASLNSIKKDQKIDVIVPMSREVICTVDGVARETWAPGRYTVEADARYDEQELRVYFVNKTAIVPMMWGTSAPIDLQDPVFEMPVRFGAHGGLKVSIENSKTFLLKVVGTQSNMDDKGLAEYFRAKTVLIFTSLLASKMAELGLSYFELAAQLQAMSAILCDDMKAEFAKYGLNVEDFTIDQIKISEDTLAKFTADKELVRRLKVREGIYEKLRKENRTNKAEDIDQQIRIIQALGQASKDAKDERDIKIDVTNVIKD